MASLEDDIRSAAGFTLYELRTRLLEESLELTPTEMVDRAISGTVKILDSQFKFQSIGACESNGDPHYCEGLVAHYWDLVNDKGEE